jgi:ABC-type transport system involved in multi-copper enzyme maturation permease subunit
VKNYIGITMVFVGLVMLFPAPIQLIRHGAGFPHEKLFAQIWLAGLGIMLLGLFINRLTSPPLHK